MSSDEKIEIARVFLKAIRFGNSTVVARTPANVAFSTHALGLCDILESVFDGDVQRALAFAEDMPMRLQMNAPSKQATDGDTK